jgi:hypothetical protein
VAIRSQRGERVLLTGCESEFLARGRGWNGHRDSRGKSEERKT